MWAAVEGHPAVVELLVKAGADVRAHSRGQFTALMFAVRQGDADSTRFLVDAGADVNDTVANGMSVLRVAIDNEHYAVAAFLLDRGANPNAVNKQGETALHALVRARAPTRRTRPADEMDSLELMKRLLTHGADPNARTVESPRLTDERVASAQRPAIDNRVNLGGATPFILASQDVDVEAMRLMLAHGADPGLSTQWQTTPLMVAAGVVFIEGSRRFRPERDALEAVTLLIDLGVDVNATNVHGQTALHGAVYRAADSIIRFLAETGARMDLRDELGRTALDLAEQGFNQVASVIRRDRSAALLRELGAESSR